MTWTQVTPSLPSDLTAASRELVDGLSSIRTALEAARALAAVATAMAQRQGSGSLASVNSIVSVLAAAIQSAIAGLLDTGGAYVLLIPMPKKGLTGLIGGPVALDSDAPVGILNNMLPPVATESLVWQDAFAQERLFHGGNAHYLRVVTEALYDGDDPNRPRFGSASYWGYAALVAGATDFAACMSIATYFDKLFGNPHGASGLRASRGSTDIVAQGVVARPSERGTQVVVEWTPLESVGVDDGSSRADATEYAVLRSEAAPAMTALRVLDLLPSATPTEGMTGRYGCKVLKVGSYNGFLHRYVDADELDAAKTYYYHVAVRSRLVNSLKNTDMGYNLLSSASRFKKSTVARTGGHGRAPDWWRTPSVARVFPGLNLLLDSIEETIHSVQSITSRATNLTSAALDALTLRVSKIERTVSELDLLLRQLEEIFNAPSAGVHIDLRKGQGSAASLIGELTQALSDFADPDRPTFDNGDEYVTGAMVLITAPNEEEFNAAWALIELLFGPSGSADPVVAAINDIVQGADSPSAPLTQDQPSLTFNEDMTPRPPGSPDSNC